VGGHAGPALSQRAVARVDDAVEAALTMAEKKAFLLRIDAALWAQIERLAQADLRSANAQVEFLLRDALARRGTAAKRSRPAAEREASD
jgi:hypothetical protein